MKREDAITRALILLAGKERPTLEDLVTGIQEAWAEGYAAGDGDGYANGYAAGFADEPNTSIADEE